MSCTRLQVVAALLLCGSCFGQDGAPAGTERQTRLVLPAAQPESVPELVVLPALVHGSPPCTVFLSSDGRTYVTADLYMTLVWDVPGRYVRWSQQRSDWMPVAISPNGTLLAMTSVGVLSMMDTRASRVLWSRPVSEVSHPTTLRSRRSLHKTVENGFREVVFSPDGAQVAVVSEGGVAAVDVASGETLADYSLAEGSEAVIRVVGYRPDGALVAAVLPSDPDVPAPELVERSTGAVMRGLVVSGSETATTLMSLDGEWLVTEAGVPSRDGRSLLYRRWIVSTDDWSVRFQGDSPYGLLNDVSRGTFDGRCGIPLPSRSGDSLRVVDLETRKARTLRAYDDLNSSPMALSRDCQLLATCRGVIDISDGRMLLALPTQRGPVLDQWADGDLSHRPRLFANDGRSLLTLGPDGHVASERPIGPGSPPVLAADGRQQRCIYTDDFVAAWAMPEGVRVMALTGAGIPEVFVPREASEAMLLSEFEPRALSLRPDGAVLVARFTDVYRWSPNEGVEGFKTDQIASLTHEPLVAFSPDGGKLGSRYYGGVGNVTIPDTGSLEAGVDLPVPTEIGSSSIQFLADSRRLVVCGYHNVVVIDTEARECLGDWSVEGESIAILAVSLDGSFAAAQEAFDHDGPVFVHQLDTGIVRGIVPSREPADVSGAVFSARGDRLLVSYSDGVATLWDVSPMRADGEGRLLATLVDWPSGDWATVTPHGYVDCSPGAGLLLGWRIGESVHPFRQFAARYHRPDLVRRALAGEDLSAEQTLSGADVPPTAAFLAPEYDAAIEGETAKVEIEVVGVRPLARVDLLIDGRPIPDELAATAKWEQIEENHGVYTFELPLSQYQRRTRLQAIVHDDSGLQSMPAEVTFTRTGAPPPATVLHALAVGVSAYRNAEWNNLKYADKDAESFAKVAGEGAARKVLLNENATASNVRFALEEMRASATEDDIVAIFLAGHGTVDAAGNYYMLLHDSDAANLGNTALPWDDFVSALKGIRAKLVMVFADTCHSGSITGQESVNTLIDRLNRKAGVVVFTASRGDEASIEREDWGHGAFTKALLEGFSGEADTYPKDKQVSLAELRDYVIQRVEELTSGRQHPYLPRLEEFDPARPIANVLPGLT